MESHQLPEESSAIEPLTGSLPGWLPMELVMDILDTAIVANHVDDICWTLTLSLVCRTVRASVLSIVYETLFLDISLGGDCEYMGWDGGTYLHARLAFLTWLLHDPSAPPRQYVKHLIFRHDSHFNDRQIRWVGPREVPTACEWPLERLTVRFVSDAVDLHRAGMRPQRAFHIDTQSPGSEFTLASFLCHIVDRLPGAGFGMHCQMWASESEDLELEDGIKTRISSLGASRKEINLEKGTYIAASGHAQFTIQFEQRDCFQRFPDLLQEGLVQVLTRYPNMSVIFSCDGNYKLKDEPLGEVIRVIVLKLRTSWPNVSDRLWISRAAWTPLIGRIDQFYTLSCILRQGGDPWDRGRPILSDAS